MKRNLLLLLLSIFMFNLNAQESSIGIKAGYNYDMGSLSFNQVSATVGTIDDIKANNGWHVGLFYKARFGEIFYWQPDLVYVRTSHDYDLNNTTSETFNHQVLEININAGVEFFDFMRAYGGIINMFNMGKTQETNDFSTTYKSYRMGYQLGLGLDFFEFLTFDLTYKGSFTDDNGELTVGNTSIDLAQNLSQLQVSVGLLF
jgi:hypothetical protein